MESSCFICSDPAAQGLSVRSLSNLHQPERPRNEVAEVLADSAPEDIRLISREHNSAGQRWQWDCPRSSGSVVPRCDPSRRLLARPSPFYPRAASPPEFAGTLPGECLKSPLATALESEPVDSFHQRSALPLASGSEAGVRCVICSWWIRRSMRIAPDVQPSTGLPVSPRAPNAGRC